MKTVDELIQRIESRFPVGAATNHSRSVSGEPYVTISAQTQETPAIEEVAIRAAYALFDDYSGGRTGTLYWRMKPRLEWDEEKTHCQVYMRLLISSKPPQ